MSSDRPPPTRWETLSHVSRLQTPVFDVFGTRFRHPVRAVEREFIVIRAPDWVNVVAVTTDDRIVLVRQFRYGVADFSLEVPGGVMEQGEDPVTSGLRELQEETGFSGAPAKLLGWVHPNPAIQANRCHFVFVETAVKAHELGWDPDEEIEILTLPVDEVLALAHSGGIVHALALNALMLFEPHWRARKKG